MRSKGFGVWKVWSELQTRGRSWTFHDGPGLAVWQKPPASSLPGFLEQLLAPPNEQKEELAQYYRERAAETKAKIGAHWRDGTIRDTPFAQQTIIQVFYSTDGSHREEDSIYARIGHDDWKNVRIELPPHAGAAPLRIDFVSALNTIEIESIRVTRGDAAGFAAADDAGFAMIKLAGDAERLPDPNRFRFRVTGIDPQLYLPVIDVPAGDAPLVLHLRLRVLP